MAAMEYHVELFISATVVFIDERDSLTPDINIIVSIHLCS
jgi:hypothetical protein